MASKSLNLNPMLDVCISCVIIKSAEALLEPFSDFTGNTNFGFRLVNE